MKTIRPTILNAILVALLAVAATGCVLFNPDKKLEPGGAYAKTETAEAMPELFLADSAFKTTYSAMKVVFDYEIANRVVLWKLSPNIKKKLDEYRDKVWEVNVEYAQARTAYLANKVPANLDAMTAALAKLTQLNAVVATVIANKGA